jgi:hypothetical protein
VVALVGAAAVLAMGIGGGVAAANQASPKAESTRPAAASSARNCSAPTTHSFPGISVSVRACLEGQAGDSLHPVTIVYSGDVEVRTTPGVAAGYCRVELEGGRHSLERGRHSDVPTEIRTLSCADLANKGMKYYPGGSDSGATSDGWTQVTVLVGANKSTARIVTATHEAIV